MRIDSGGFCDSARGDKFQRWEQPANIEDALRLRPLGTCIWDMPARSGGRFDERRSMRAC